MKRQKMETLGALRRVVARVGETHGARGMGEIAMITAPLTLIETDVARQVSRDILLIVTHLTEDASTYVTQIAGETANGAARDRPPTSTATPRRIAYRAMITTALAIETIGTAIANDAALHRSPPLSTDMCLECPILHLLSYL